jgi:hypothetical protein
VIARSACEKWPLVKVMATLVMAEYFETPPTIDAATDVRYELSGSLDGITTERGIIERS